MTPDLPPNDPESTDGEDRVAHALRALHAGPVPELPAAVRRRAVAIADRPPKPTVATPPRQTRGGWLQALLCMLLVAVCGETAAAIPRMLSDVAAVVTDRDGSQTIVLSDGRVVRT